MNTRVVASVLNNIQTDQRLHKVCNTLVKDGFDVLLIGATNKKKPVLPTVFQTKLLSMFFGKSIFLYLEFNVRLFFYLLFLPKKNTILLANDLDSLLPNVLIAKIFKLKVVYDSHEIFTELPSLQNRKFKKRTWSLLEYFLLPHVNAFYTVSRSYAKWFKAKYGIKPKIVRNLPVVVHSVRNQVPIVPLPKKNNPKEKIIIYQGTLNQSRGLELMIECMNYLENVQFWILGNGPLRAQLQEQAKALIAKNRIFFLGKILPKELKKITPRADLGLSLEQDNGLSYRYALPNKVFDYVHAGVPVLGSDLNELVYIIRQYKIGRVCKSKDPKEVAFLIERMLEEGKETYAKHLQQAANNLHWAKDSQTLLEIFNDLKEIN